MANSEYWQHKKKLVTKVVLYISVDSTMAVARRPVEPWPNFWKAFLDTYSYMLASAKFNVKRMALMALVNGLLIWINGAVPVLPPSQWHFRASHWCSAVKISSQFLQAFHASIFCRVSTTFAVVALNSNMNLFICLLKFSSILHKFKTILVKL